MQNNTFPPHSFIIPHDEYQSKYVGIAESGDQFFITTPFTWGTRKVSGREFVVCYIFDKEGRLKKALIDELGVFPDLGVDDESQ